MDKIYVVEGSTGEYSDNTHWLVQAFRSENKAKAAVVILSQFARESFKLRFDQIRKGPWPGDVVFSKINDKHDGYVQENIIPLDPNFREDYTGTNYTYTEIELND